ncbi:MAG: hypothetical protein NVS3B12_29910 [Acidimicrobiales bacterium]
MTSFETMEDGLDALETDIDLAIKAVSAVARELKKAKAAAAGGTVRDLRRLLDSAGSLVDEAAEAVSTAERDWDFDATEYLSSGRWAKEVIAAASARGLSVAESDERLVCYPSLLKVLPTDAAIEIDRRRERRLRPSVVVEALAAAQGRPARFRPEPFLEALEDAYGWVVQRGGERTWGSVVRLVDVWSVLTLLPGAARDYTRPEFARDLYLLDQSGKTAARSGRTLRFAASTGTKSAGVLTTVTADGRPVNYWGVAFE